MKTQNNFTLTTPVLFLTFNRLDTTKQVFEEIKKTKPKQLFLASDGPRENKEGEKEKVEEVRKHLLNNIDWKCEVKTLFREKNLGCKYAVSGAIDWFFEDVEQGIILEDDCLPSQSFFRFCQEMLERYEDFNEVKAICGTNFIENNRKGEAKNSHIFSSFAFSPWGWATWRRAWGIDEKKIKRDFEKKEIKSPNFLHNIIFRKKLKDVFLGKTSSWAYLFNFKIIKDKGKTIFPQKNLVENIGFVSQSTHNFNNIDKKYQHIIRQELNFPLNKVNKEKTNIYYDWKLICMVTLRILEKKMKGIIK